MNKEEILKKAYQELNRSDYPFEVTIDNDSIIANWKWKDGTFFESNSVTSEVQTFRYTVHILDDFKYIDNDSSFSSKGVVGKNIGKSFEFHSGQQYRKHIEFTFGKDKETGKIKIHKYSLDTDKIHKPIREFLERNGYTRLKTNTLDYMPKGLLKMLGCLFTFLGLIFLISFLTLFLNEIPIAFVLILIMLPMIFLVVGVLLLLKSKK